MQGGEMRERRLLLASAVTTMTLAAVAIAAGRGTGAKSIVFDGMYDVVDAGMTMVAWQAARLIARGDDARFQYGYWHIEPMLAFVNGAVLAFACVYAAVDAVDALIAGGRPVRFGIGIAYAAVGTVVSLAAWAVVRRRSRGLGSVLLELDARSWLLGGLLSAGLFVSFVAAWGLEGTRAAPLAAYVDPAILLVLACAMAPLPIRTMLRAGREVLQIAPADLDARVRQVAADVAARHGFVEYRSYVTRAGRAQFIEIGLVAPSSAAAFTMERLDAIRAELAGALGGRRPGNWLTVDFTADAAWI